MAKTSACALQEETQNSIQERTALYINVARRFACHTYSIMRNYEWLLQCTGAGAISIVADGIHYQISVFSPCQDSYLRRRQPLVACVQFLASGQLLYY